MNNSKYKCCCGMEFKTERSWKFHMTRCDCGKTKDICKMERMRSPIISTFLDNLFISTQCLYIEDDLDRFIKFFKEALCKIDRREMSYFIKDVKKDGVILIKGLQDLTLRKEGDKYVSYEWITLTGDEFFNYIIPYLNDKIDGICNDKNLIGYKLLKADNVGVYLRELKKLSK